KQKTACDITGVREALDGCGLLVRSRRPHELAQGMVKLLQDENLRHQLEAAAIKKVHDEFTLEKCVENFKKEYENLTRTHSSQESPREVI
ncbi:hypothetical protein HW44_18035, partial [Nitrosococcus oceani]